MKILFRKKKLPAFTIPELVVTMILTVLLFLLASTAYNAVAEQASLIKKRNAYYEDYYIEHSTLTREWEEADHITQPTENKILLENKKKNIIYIFTKKYIIRQDENILDTLSPGGVPAHREFYDSSIHLLTSLQIEHIYRGRKFYTFLNKTYSSEQLLNYHSIKPEENE